MKMLVLKIKLKIEERRHSVRECEDPDYGFLIAEILNEDWNKVYNNIESSRLSGATSDNPQFKLAGCVFKALLFSWLPEITLVTHTGDWYVYHFFWEFSFLDMYAYSFLLKLCSYNMGDVHDVEGKPGKMLLLELVTYWLFLI